MKIAKRLEKLPPYLFADLDRQKKEVRAKGLDLIDLTIGNPDIPPADLLVERLKKELADACVHRYPDYIGCEEYRTAVSRWMAKRYNAKVDPGNEITSLIGSKEGLAHLILGIVNPEDATLVPSPGYPVYSQGTTIAGASSCVFPLKSENNFLPEFDRIPKDILKKAKILFLNYPNNPTSACATHESFEKAIELAHKYDFLICHDAAYIEIYEGEKRPLSILSLPGAKEVAVELHSFSKTFSIPGWRVAFAAGNKEAIGVLSKVKENVDSGTFTAIERTISYAMDNLEGEIDKINSVYAKRRKLFVSALDKLGFEICGSKATFYIWAKIPGKTDSIDFCKDLMNKTAVAATPGLGFGKEGEGFVRFSMTTSTERLEEAAGRISKL